MTPTPAAPPANESRTGPAGPLQQAYTLTLHTRAAQGIYTGRGSARSVYQFANAVFHLRALTALDRPLVEACLLEVERELEALDDELSRRRPELESMIRKVEADGLTLSFAVSGEPGVYAGESFGSPYGYRAVAVLSRFDKVALLLHTANAAALISNQQRKDEINAYAKRFRRLFGNTVLRFGKLRKADLGLTAAQCADPACRERLATALKELALPELTPAQIAGRETPAWGLDRRDAALESRPEGEGDSPPAFPAEKNAADEPLLDALVAAEATAGASAGEGV